MLDKKKKTFLQYVEEKYKPIERALNTPIKNTITRQKANSLSAIDGVLNRIPNPYTQFAGYLLQAPDMLYDVKDFTVTPNMTTGTEVVLDVPMKFNQLPGYVDDVASTIGIANDAVGGITGQTIVEHVSKRKQKRHLDETKGRMPKE